MSIEIKNDGRCERRQKDEEKKLAEEKETGEQEKTKNNKWQ